MRTILALLVGVVVLLTGFWAYQENYSTRQTLAELRGVQRDIGALRAELAVLDVEWAYLNRPERLRVLADLNFERLELIPMRPEHFGHIDQVAYPPKPPEAVPPEDVDPETLAAELLLSEAIDPAAPPEDLVIEDLRSSQLVVVSFDKDTVLDVADMTVPDPVPDEKDGQFP